MSVLPWPGVTAWPAPRPRAVRTDRSSTIGLRSTDWKIAGSSPPAPPGPAPTTPIPAAAGAAGGAVAAGVASAAAAVPIGAAWGVAAIVTERMSSGWLIMSAGYDVRRFEGLVAGRPLASIVTPSPDATTSRQPILSVNDGAEDGVVVGPLRSAGGSAANPHSIPIRGGA